MRMPRLFGLLAEPGKELSWLYGAIPLVFVIGIYTIAERTKKIRL